MNIFRRIEMKFSLLVTLTIFLVLAVQTGEGGKGKLAR